MKPAGESSEVPAKAGIRGRIPIVYLVLFELVLGSAISLGLFLLARNVEKAHSAQEFASQAGARHEALQRSLDGAVDALYSVKALVESHGQVQREAFRVFAEHLLSRHPEILSVEWLPRVEGGRRAAFTSQVRNSGFPDFQIRKAVSPGIFKPAPEADEYFPVLYVEPLEKNREALGLDPGWEPSRAAIMRRARETRTAAATEPVELLRQPAGARQLRAVILFVPVYLTQPAEQAPGEARQTLAGFARTVLLVQQLVETAWRDLPRGEMDSVIRDANDPDDAICAYPAADAAEQPAGHHAPLLRRQHWIGRVQLADRTWQLECVLPPGTPALAWGWLTRSVLGGSLATTFLGAGYVWTTLRRRQERDLANLRDSAERKRAEAAIQERLALEERLSHLASTIPGAIFAFRLRPDGSSCFPYISPRVRELFGLSPEELREDSAPAFKAVHPEDVVPLRAAIAQAAKTQAPWKVTFRGRNTAGDWVWLEGSSVPVREPKGDIVWHGFMIDVTERERADQALHASEQRFRNIYQHASIGIAIANWEGRFIQCNPSFCTITGHTEPELRQLTFASLIHPDDRAGDLSLADKLRRGDFSFFEVESRYVRKDGAAVWVHKFVSVLRDDKGDPVSLMALVTDVTERKLAEERLRLQSVALEAAANSILLTDHNGIIRWINPAFVRMTGYTAPEVIGRTPAILKSGKQDTAYYREMWTTILSGKVWQGELVNRRKDGSLYSELMTITPVPGTDGSGGYFVAIKQDVTERRKAQDKIRRERERLRRMVDTAQVGIVFVSPEGEIREINDALLQMIGWTRDGFAAHGLSWQELTPAEFRELDIKSTQELLDRGSTGPTTRILLRKDGSRVPVLCNGVRLPSEEGKEFAIFVLDQTEQRRLERALQDADEATQGRIARDLHDGLGQQLAGILYVGRMLHQDLEGRGAPEVNQVAELNRAMKEALEMTRQVARGLHPVPAGPDGLMLALETLAEQVTAGGKLEFIFECEPPVLLEDVRVASHLYRIAQEAVTNALKHSQAKRVEVALWQDPKAIYLSVRDNGVGLLHGPAGRGLGMQTMKHRAQLIGGLLTLENAPDGGVLVSCRIPHLLQHPAGEQSFAAEGGVSI